MLSGSWTTPMTSPVSTSTFSKTFVNRPKNAFQSPGTHRATARGPRFAALAIMMSPPSCHCLNRLRERGEKRVGRSHPTEDAALRFDHLQRHLVELGKVRGDAV